jgi:hypothetical protein
MTADLSPSDLPEEHRDLEVLARCMNFENMGRSKHYIYT